MNLFGKIPRLGIGIAIGSALCASVGAAPVGATGRDAPLDSALSAPWQLDAAIDRATGGSARSGEFSDRTPRAANSICTWQSCAPQSGDSPWTLAGFGLATGAAVWLGRKPRDSPSPQSATQSARG
ncbi:MAG TPA: hypothetical protein EYQ54_09310 [Myxococcales bacterium]|nr:hypothetical protein [Myxococcales bacterium]